MPKMIYGVSSIRLAVPALYVLLVAACTATIEVEPEHDEPPLFRQIDARVGTYFTSEARTAAAAHTLAAVEIGEISVSRFGQAFESMFAETVPMPDWPPWRTESHTGIDGIIELERVDAEIKIGDDAPDWIWIDSRDNPDIVRVEYRVCFYEPDGREVQCWETSASRSHQRKPFECVNIRKCLEPQFEAAIRDAVATFMVIVEKDPTFLAWANRNP